MNLMISACLILMALGGGGQEKGLALLAEGRPEEAAAAFQSAIDDEGPSAELCYNLALAQWKAGQFDDAEVAAEQAATLSDGAMSDLRDGLLGNLRFTRAEAAAESDPQAALQLAEKAREHYLRGASVPHPRPEIVRNVERAQRLIEELKKKLEDQEKQQDKQPDQQGDEDKQADEQKQDEQEQDEQKNDDQKNDEQKPDEQKPDEPKPDEQKQDEPKPDEQKQDEGQPQDQQDPQPESSDEQQPEPKPGEDPSSPPPEQKEQPPAPGEQRADLELSPEEKKRLNDKLDELENLRQQLRLQQKARRPKVEKDW